VKSVETKFTDADVKEGEKNEGAFAGGDYKQYIDYKEDQSALSEEGCLTDHVEKHGDVIGC